MSAEDPLLACMKLTALLSSTVDGVVNTRAPGVDRLREVALSLSQARSVLSKYYQGGARPGDALFDVCLTSLRNTLERMRLLLSASWSGDSSASASSDHAAGGLRRQHSLGSSGGASQRTALRMSASASDVPNDWTDDNGGSGSGDSDGVEVVVEADGDDGQDESRRRGAVLTDQNTASLCAMFRLDFAITESLLQLGTMFPGGTASIDPLTVLEDAQAREWWAASFGPRANMVPWDRFVAALPSLPGLVVVRGEWSDDDRATMRHFIDFLGDGVVTPFEVKAFCRWFGPLSHAVAQLLHCVRHQRICAGFMPALEAETVLAGRAPGHFLLRFSRTKLGAVAVTFVDDQSNVRHVLLYHTGKPCVGGHTLRDPPRVYASLPDFVEANRKRLTTVVVARHDENSGTSERTLHPLTAPLMMTSASGRSSGLRDTTDSELFDAQDAGFVSTDLFGSPNEAVRGGSSDSNSRQSASGSGQRTSNDALQALRRRSSGSGSSMARVGSQAARLAFGMDATGINTAASASTMPLPRIGAMHLSDDGADSPATTNGGGAALTCVVCMDRRRDVLFLECGHLACCQECGGKLTTCPMCRQPIARQVRVFE